MAKVVDPYYAKRAAAKGQALPPAPQAAIQPLPPMPLPQPVTDWSQQPADQSIPPPPPATAMTDTSAAAGRSPADGQNALGYGLTMLAPIPIVGGGLSAVGAGMIDNASGHTASTFGGGAAGGGSTYAMPPVNVTAPAPSAYDASQDPAIQAKMAAIRQATQGIQTDERMRNRQRAGELPPPTAYGAPFSKPLDAATNAQVSAIAQPVSGGGGGEFDPSSPRMQNLAAASQRPSPAAVMQPTNAFDPQLMAQITANRQAAEAARAAKLSGEGMSPEAIDARMFPQHGVTPDPMRAQARAIDFAERQGRVNASAMADRLMRQAAMNGQQMPMAQAYAIAMNMTPTTVASNQGAVPSLPGMDPSRMALFNPSAGAVAGQFQNGQGANANTATRDQLQANTAQQGIAQQGANQQGQNWVDMFRAALGYGAATQNAGSAAQVQAQQILAAEMARPPLSPYDPGYAQREQYLQHLRSVAYPGAAGAGAAPSPGVPGAAPSPGALGNSFSGGIPPGIGNSPQHLAQWLATQPAAEQPRLQAEALIAAGHVDHPAIDAYAQKLAANDPSYGDGFAQAPVSTLKGQWAVKYIKQRQPQRTP